MNGQPIDEQEQFYGNVNRVIEENSTEIQLGLAYAKYSIWKAIFCSPLGQVCFALAILGLYWIFGPMGVAVILIGLVVLTIVKVTVGICRLFGSTGVVFPTIASIAVLYGLVQLIGRIWY